MIDWRVNAIHSLCPNSVWRNTENNELIWDDSNSSKKPTEAEIDAEIEKQKAEYDAQEYARKRAVAYPSIGDQLDMQYHDQIDGTTTWKDAIAKVKADNPKEGE